MNFSIVNAMYIFSEQIYLNGTVPLLTLRPVFLIESLIYLDLNVQNIKLIQNFHYTLYPIKFAISCCLHCSWNTKLSPAQLFWIMNRLRKRIVREHTRFKYKGQTLSFSICNLALIRLLLSLPRKCGQINQRGKRRRNDAPTCPEMRFLRDGWRIDGLIFRVP